MFAIYGSQNIRLHADKKFLGLTEHLSNSEKS